MRIFDILRRTREPALSANRCTVSFDEIGVVCRRPDGQAESVGWADLRAVLIRTTSEGPFVDDVFWVLVGAKGGCVVPSESAGVQQFMERLQRLPGFDNRAVTAAMCCTADKDFLCWVCEEDKKSLEDNGPR